MNRLTDIYLGSTHSYILKDNQGSWTTIIDDEGNVEQELSFDAWGNLRNPETWSGGSSAHPMFDRGYTGHEHITGFGLINMNGRCYDPLTSAFLSVDAYVQDPASAQAFNRYAYCCHNPLRFTDPTGWQYGPQSYYVNPNLNPGTHTTYHSDDPNDMLWGKTSHPHANSSSGYANGVTVTGTRYVEGNSDLHGSNYTVDRQGYINNEGGNENSFDVLYTEECWKNGEKDVYIEIPLGILGGRQTITGEGTNGNNYTFDLYTVKGDEFATELFEFLAINTDVEWSHTFIGGPDSQKSVLSTSHIENSEAGQAYLFRNGWTIKAHNHSHPYNNTPSPSDKIWASTVQKKFPHVSLNIYYRGIYYEYNKEGLIYKNIDSDLKDVEIFFNTKKP